MSSELKVNSIRDTSNNEAITISSGNVSFNNTISAGTLGSSVVFPAGHIVQSVLNPTITNTSTTKNTTNTPVGVADVINQISITSGNGVLIYLMCGMQIIDNTNAYGRIEICEGTVASIGSVLKDNRFGLGGNPGNFDIPISMWAYDSSPTDTTPDYVVTIAKDSGSTTSAGLATDSSVRLTIFLFEVKQ